MERDRAELERRLAVAVEELERDRDIFKQVCSLFQPGASDAQRRKHQRHRSVLLLGLD